MLDLNVSTFVKMKEKVKSFLFLGYIFTPLLDRCKLKTGTKQKGKKWKKATLTMYCCYAPSHINRTDFCQKDWGRVGGVLVKMLGNKMKLNSFYIYNRRTGRREEEKMKQN